MICTTAGSSWCSQMVLKFSPGMLSETFIMVRADACGGRPGGHANCRERYDNVGHEAAQIGAVFRAAGRAGVSAGRSLPRPPHPAVSLPLVVAAQRPPGISAQPQPRGPEPGFSNRLSQYFTVPLGQAAAVLAVVACVQAFPPAQPARARQQTTVMALPTVIASTYAGSKMQPVNCVPVRLFPLLPPALTPPEQRRRRVPHTLRQ